MTHITKHNTKHEWKSDTSENSRIDFFVIRETISVNNLLESTCELICLKIGGRSNRVIVESFNVSGWEIRELFPYHFLVCHRGPVESNVWTCTLPHIVKGMVEWFFSGYEPFVNTESTDFLRANSIISTELIDLNEVTSELCSWGLKKSFWFINIFSYF